MKTKKISNFNMPIKVCHVISSLELGGAQLLLEKLCMSLKSSEFTHVIVCLSGETVLAKKIQHKSIKIYFLDMFGLRNIIHSVFKLRRILENEQPSIIHSWLYHADFLTTLARYRLRTCPLLWSVHHANEKSEGDKLLTKWLVKLLSLLSNKFPSRIVYCSEYARAVHARLGYCSGKSFVINNGIDTIRFCSSLPLRERFRQQQGIGLSTAVVGMVARYSPIKGHKIFLDMARILLTMETDIRFVMIGTNISASNRELIGIIDSLGLRDYCTLLEEQSDIERAMNGLDILVCPSFSESFGLVVVEALACEVPVVCSDLEVLRDIVGQRFTAPVGNSHLFARKTHELVRATRAERKTIGSQGRKQVIKNYDENVMIEKYRQLYHELLHAGVG